jgi:hypothetical protein
MAGSRPITLASLALMLIGSLAWGQQNLPGLPQPRLDIITPQGGQRGTTLAEVNLTGGDLEETQTLIFSHPGITAERLPDPAPPKVDPKKPEPKKEAPKLVGKFKITIKPDVPVGTYDVRTVSKLGVSNPRAFVVGDLPEFAEKEPNNDLPEAMKVTINSTISGTIQNGTDIDYFAFSAKKGQRILFHCVSMSIDGRAQPLLEIFEPTGKRITFNRNYSGDDALADFIVPNDGDFFLRLSEFTYTSGGPNNFYRLKISTTPWIDAVVPSAIEAGKASQVTVYGRNLPGGQPDPEAKIDGKPLEKLVVSITPPSDPLASQRLSYPGFIEPKAGFLDGFPYSITSPAGASNPILVGICKEPNVLEKEPNDKTDAPQDVPIPCEIQGRVDKRSDVDWFRFNAKKGDILWIELLGDRIGMQSFTFFTLRNAKTKQDIVEVEDTNESIGRNQFYTRNGDPLPYKFMVQEDGQYLLKIGCRESNFLYGPRVNYRVRIGATKPDFRLLVMPSNDKLPEVVTMRADGANYYDVFVDRRDGFTGPIELNVEGLPAGVTAAPQLIGTNAKQGSIVLNAAANLVDFQGQVKVVGKATINGQPVIREARAATISWGQIQNQNAPALARLDQGLFVATRDKSMLKLALDLEKSFIKAGELLKGPYYLKPGEKLTVPFKIMRGNPELKQPIIFQQVAYAPNMGQAAVVVNNGQPMPPVNGDKNDGTFVVEVKGNALPGVYPIILQATTQLQYSKDPNGKKQNIAIVQPTSPFLVTVIPTAIGKITFNPIKVMQGKEAELLVKVERLAEYTGEFKVKVTLPGNVKGIELPEITIPANQTEVKVVVKASMDATVGNFQNLPAVATGIVESKIPITQEAKLNLQVEKAPEPKKVEPKKVEPKKEEPKKPEMKKEEPKKVEPKKEEPKKPEVKKEEPKKVEPKKEEPKKK